MTIAYLVNQYPTASHSFIRREIRALESLGETVSRYSIRSTADLYVDPSDAEEAMKTTVVLRGRGRLTAALAREAARNPLGVTRALRTASAFASRSDRPVAYHGAYLAEACELLGHFRASPVSHLHAHFGTNSALVALLCHQLGGPPYSVTIHGPEEFDRAPLLGLSDLIINAKFVAAISEYGRSQLCRLVERRFWDKIHVVRCGLDGSMLGREPTAIRDCNRLLSIGRLHEQKGQLVLLDAAAALAAEGARFHLTLVGDGPLRAELEGRITELGLQSHVTLAGWMTQAEVMAELDASAALVLPSFAEGLPVVIMEAFALGRPVLSTYVAGIPELVRPGVNGWLVPAGATRPLVDAMREILESSAETLSTLGREGRREVLERHDAALSAARLRALFSAAA
jgi:colanic acid/amylovoran biosynthesis glycosyltransferase